MQCHIRGFLRSVYPPDVVICAYRSILCRMVQAPHSRDVGMGYSVCLALSLPPFHSDFVSIVIETVSSVVCFATGAKQRLSYIVVGEAKI